VLILFIINIKIRGKSLSWSQSLSLKSKTFGIWIRNQKLRNLERWRFCLFWGKSIFQFKIKRYVKY